MYFNEFEFTESKTIPFSFVDKEIILKANLLANIIENGFETENARNVIRINATIPLTSFLVRKMKMKSGNDRSAVTFVPIASPKKMPVRIVKSVVLLPLEYMYKVTNDIRSNAVSKVSTFI